MHSFNIGAIAPFQQGCSTDNINGINCLRDKTQGQRGKRVSTLTSLYVGALMSAEHIIQIFTRKAVKKYEIFRVGMDNDNAMTDNCTTVCAQSLRYGRCKFLCVIS